MDCYATPTDFVMHSYVARHMRWPDGRTYEGEYVEDRKSGEGAFAKFRLLTSSSLPPSPAKVDSIQNMSALEVAWLWYQSPLGQCQI